MAGKWVPALPTKPLPVNGLFAALPQIEVVGRKLSAIRRHTISYPLKPPMALARHTPRAIDNGPAWTIEQAGTNEQERTR